LVSEVDLLVLDEPTNHLDIDAIGWLEARLARFRGGLVLVTHDRHVLDRVTTRMLELDRGRGYIHDGGYTSFLAARAERVERDAGAEAVRRNLARAELAWLRRGAGWPSSAPTDRGRRRCSTSWPGAWPRPRAGWRWPAPSCCRTTTRPAGTSIPASGCGRRWPARRGSRAGSRCGSWSGFGSTP